jgi:ankyrin repeat protein
MKCSFRIVLCWSFSMSICFAAETSSLTRDLIAACKRNDLPAVQQCISDGVDVDAADEAGLPPLFYAAAAKNPQIVRLLLDHKAKVDAPHSGLCLMVRALQTGNLEIFKMLAADGGDLHRRYQIGQRENGTLLHLAIMNENTEMIRYLLSQKVSTETRNSDGESALLLAAQLDNPEIVQLLIENGAYLYADRGFGGTLLDSEMYRPSPQIKRYLQEIEQKRLSEVVEPGWTKFVQQETPFSRIETQPIEDFLLQGGSLTGTDKTGRTLLHCLAGADLTGKDFFEQAVSILEQEINTPDIHGNTPLHTACQKGKAYQVRILLDHGADVHARNHEESTPLLILTRWHFNHKGETEHQIATQLLDMGADVNAINAFGYTALLYLGESDTDDKLDLTRLFVDRGADLNQQDYQGNTFLHNASDRGSAAMMEIVIEAGADLSIRNFHGSSIQDSARYDKEEKLDILYQYKKDVTLHEAVYYSQSALVDQILQTGTDINGKNKSGYTPLMLASMRNDSAMVKKLLGLGADLNAQEKSGRTALHYAAEQGYDEVVYDLLSNKADVSLRDQEGFRAVDLAAAEHKHRTLQLFKDAYPDIKPSSTPVVTETPQ